MLIRRAKREDTPAIGELLLQVAEIHHKGRPDLFKSQGRKYTDEEVQDMLEDDRRPIFVAVDEGQRVLGYAFCQHVCHEDDTVLTDVKTLYIDDLCVDEAARGQAIGRALYEHVLAYARECGCHNVTLNVWAKNEGAIAFYRKLGLTPQKYHLEQIL